MKVQAHSFLEPPPEYKSGADAFDELSFIMIFLTILGVMEILCISRLVLQGEIGKQIPESSRLDFLEKFFGNNFALSNAEDNTTWPLNRGDVADLPLLKTLLAMPQNS